MSASRAVNWLLISTGVSGYTDSSTQFRVYGLRATVVYGVHALSAGQAARTRARVNGTVRRRTPVASNTALATAAGTGAVAASPAPSSGSLGG